MTKKLRFEILILHSCDMSMNRTTERSPMEMLSNEGQPKEGSLASGDIGSSPPEAPAEREQMQDRRDTSVSAMDICQREDTVPAFVCAYSIDQWNNFEVIAKKKRKATLDVESNVGTVDFSAFFGYVKDIPFIKAKFDDTIQSMGDFRIPKSDLVACLRGVNATIEICENLTNTNQALLKVDRDLLILSNLSQAEEGTSFSRKRSVDGNSKVNTAIPQHEIERFERHREKIKIAEIGKYFNDLKEKRVKLERFAECGRKIGAFDELTPLEQNLLTKFSDSLQSAFKTATLLKKKAPEEFKNSLASLEEKLRGSATFPGTGGDLFLPGPLSPEVECVQPLLVALLRSLGTACENLNPESTVSEDEDQPMKKSKPPTPHKIIKQDRAVAGTSLRQKRIADEAVAADGCFKFFHFDDSIEVTAEIKPGERMRSSGSGEGPIALRKQGENQKLSHLAKHLYVGFNFVGLGTDTMATGMFLTVTHVQFTQLKLVNMGTPDAKLVLHQSSTMPLLSLENFTKYVKAGSEKFPQDWEQLKQEMYGTGEQPQQVDGSATTSVPSGLVALFNIMTTSRADLFGPSGFTSRDVDELLGTGSFASVHSVPNYENVVVKLSRYGASELIENEAKVLRALQMETSAPGTLSNNIRITSKDVCIVQLLSTGGMDIEIEIGGVSKSLPGLHLAPRGLPASRYLASINDFIEKNRRLKYIGARLFAAVDYMHSKGFHHRDISVDNIMIDPQTLEPFFVDFGLSCNKTKLEKGFVGSPRFTHREIFEKYPSDKYYPDPKYDKSALAFSMAALSRKGHCPWVSFQPRTLNKDRRQEFEAWADQRSEKAWKCLEDSTFKEEWKVWCFDKNNR